MPRVVWTPPALRDVARLHGFLAPKNRDAARRAIRAIRQGVRALATHPEIGRPVEEMAPEFREWFIQFGDSGYVAFIIMTASWSRSWPCGMARKPVIERCNFLPDVKAGAPQEIRAAYRPCIP